MSEVLASASTSRLMAHLEALREGRHPTPSAQRKIETELRRRVPKGCILVWKEKQAWSRF